MSLRLRVLHVILVLILVSIPWHGKAIESDQESVIKVLTFNLHGWEVEWPTRLSMIVDELEELQPDVIGLQEVLQTPGSGGVDNSAKVIADSLYHRTGIRYDYMFERTHTGWGRYDEGLGIMTRHSIVEKGVRDLPAGVFQRKVLYCGVLTPVGFVHFFDTHLSHLPQDEPVRVAQVQAIREYVEAKRADGRSAANIVCGDFNATPDSPPIRILTEVDSGGVYCVDSWADIHPGQPGYTDPAEAPQARIDYVFLKAGDKSEVLDSRLVLNRPGPGGIYPSDHFGVFSTFETTLNRLDVSLLSPLAGDRVSGQVDITWTCEHQPDSLSIILFFSDDGGERWSELWSGQREENIYRWNTLSVSDGTQYMLRLVAMGDSSFGMTEPNGTFTVDNPGNAPPEIDLKDPRGGELIQDEYEVKWTAADADGDPLLLSIDVSLDNGATWNPVVTDEPNDGAYLWETRGRPNSPYYRMQLRCTDGFVEVTETSQPFTLGNRRAGLPDSIFSHVAGDGDGLIGGNVIDPLPLTGHVYRITFDDTLSEQKTYNVFDLDAGSLVVRDAIELDGVTEGPAFDGLRLVIFDYSQAAIDHAHSGWVIGNSSMTHTISLPELNFGEETIRGYPYPADYRLHVCDHIADTSSSFLGAIPTPLAFTVWNITENRQVDVLFNEMDQNGILSPHDEVYILEEDGQGEPFLTWLIFFTGHPSSLPPEPGDEFVLATLKPFTHRDIFEFTTSPRTSAGDVNDDGTVNILDVVAIINHILEIETLTGSNLWRADCTADQLVNVLDVACVVNRILGIT
jgi:endonuclease/exonuclease/phosphatase family metal-dependent hydrolase